MTSTDLRPWLEPLTRPGSWLLIGVNLLPLIGVLWLGWDAATLVLLYWLETAVIGFWLLIRVSVARREQLGATLKLAGGGKRPVSGTWLGLFILAHAGVFMAVHLFFLTAVLPGEWKAHLFPPTAFVTEFLIPSGIWLPLGGLFLVRGVITLADIRADAPIQPVVAGFYFRIIVMQTTVILGSMLALAFGGAGMLGLLVLIKTGIDLYAESFIARALQGAQASS